MNKEMIISAGDHETRVAILEDDQVVEVFIEREKQRGVVGNVYKGRVNKVLPGMQSSFVDIGLERDAFLYVSEVVNTVEEFERLAGDDEDEAVVALGTPPPEAVVAAESVEAADIGETVTVASRASCGVTRPTQRAARTPWPRTHGLGRRASRPKRRPSRRQDRRPAERGAGHPRAGRQGATRHQGRAPDLPRHHARPVPRVHANGGSRRRVAEDRLSRRARPAARHRPRVPRAARLHRRRHHQDCCRRPIQGRHRQRPLVFPPGVDRDPPEDGGAARTCRCSSRSRASSPSSCATS